MSATAHLDAANQLLADGNDHPESPGESRVLTQAAIAHALLGLLEIQIAKLPDDGLATPTTYDREWNVVDRERVTAVQHATCAHPECGEDIYQHANCPWLHKDSGLVWCFQNSEDNSTARP